MPRGGAIAFGDREKLDVLRVACRKCDRSGQYRVANLIAVGWSTGRDALTSDCPRRQNDRVALNDLCGTYFPELAALTWHAADAVDESDRIDLVIAYHKRAKLQVGESAKLHAMVTAMDASLRRIARVRMTMRDSPAKGLAM